ncbi:BREX-1 system adenine-specific DNA-methyltransferase PglX [Clostridium bornimense]|uniref:BREX-1 system adenine-specific DNA-methyltransferase PglX n=1 Tax=Clostridium bornimense TaxID=1216932 RepID=UPI001C105D96|nr:BREX-1 system adenine-specific DNA-methyltransferase PglX [Clostridium bornimense]MBU5317589.1 BREX-1 system adenine-specific DNA-methyltransferase PglX [Clostridium bornimense]
MDKNKIKSFAIWARRNLISSVIDKANRIGIYDNKIIEATAVQGGFKLEGKEDIIPLSKTDRDILVNEIRGKGFNQVMEEVAYTWFNRFMALRYMEVNDYLPSGIRILSSSVEEKTEPDVLSKVSEIIDELGLKVDEIYKLLDTGDTSDREKAYRNILVKQCNELGKIIPQMFEKISDYTELLLPDNLLEEDSVIRKMVVDIEESDWLEEVEIIGWMYQYYISEKKGEVFAALKKNVKITKENIPAATQLFTPKWIVKYMVENSLGRLWLEGHPNEELQRQWKYYLEEAEQEPEVEKELKKIREEHSKLRPEDIKVLDPCMGSGHILVYAFDVLYEIYKSAGYSEREIPKLILQNNLYGLDIDDRAAQLASFALIMKARHYNRRLFREIEPEDLELNLCSIQESNEISEEVTEYFANSNEELMNDVKYLVDVFTDAKEYGSILEVEKVNFEALKKRLKEIENDNFMFGEYRKILLDKFPMIIKQTEIMSKKYEICTTNPPYLGRKGMNIKLTKYIDSKYINTKQDLYAVFMERTINYTKRQSYCSMINQHSWMFLVTFEKFRQYINTNLETVNMLHLGTRSFDEIGGEVVQTTTFVFRNKNNNEYIASYIDLTKGGSEQTKENIFFQIDKIYRVKLNNYINLPFNVVAYWISNKFIEIFKNNKKLIDYASPKQGLATGENDRFLRFWSEVDFSKIKLNAHNGDELTNSMFKWVPYNKGGEFRKWYGNNYYIVMWENNGYEIKNFKNEEGKLKSRPQNTQFYFSQCLTWSKVNIGGFSVRFIPNGFIFDVAGCSIFMEDNIEYFLGLLNSKVINKILSFLSPTLNYEVGNIASIPIPMKPEKKIVDLVNLAIKIAKDSWDSFDVSWDFKVHPLLKLTDKGKTYKLQNVFLIWKTECEENFNQLKYNEEELNRIFIDIYGLQDELPPEVDDKDITIRKADRERDIKSFISYAVGCMFGRYSIDSEGLIYAGGDFNDKWNFENDKVRKIEKDEDGNILSDTWIPSRFVPDRKNIIPITEYEYFEDDIVSKFIEFVKIVYGEETIEENLDFVSDSIGRKPAETSRQAIRRYFIKDFYKDHLKVYQKRPIYWMFDSGKNDGFKCLVYMHRYDEQTVAKVRTDYLHPLQRKYEAEINRLLLVVDSDEYSYKDRAVAKKKIDRITKQIEECKEYDKVVSYLANEKIVIDLDDGVKINYAKFQGIKVINSKGKEVSMNLFAKI